MELNKIVKEICDDLYEESYEIYDEHVFVASEIWKRIAKKLIARGVDIPADFLEDITNGTD